jgi:hypothetical protein
MSSLVSEFAFPLGDDTTDEDNRIVKILKTWTSTLQPIEDTAQAMILQKNVDDAEGAQLDALGKLVGQGRAGLSDELYRKYIKAKIVVNRSDGVVEDLIKILVLVLDDNTATIVVQNEGTATVRVRVGSSFLTDALALIYFGFLFRAKSGGVRLIFQWGDVPDSQLFRFDIGPGLDTGHLAGQLG